MVIQRDKVIEIWGNADAYSSLVIKFKGISKKLITDKKGNWHCTLNKMPAGGPYNMLLIGLDTLTISNIMIGEVWLASGQSNMNMPIAGWGRINNYQDVIDNASDPLLRMFTVNRNNAQYQYEPRREVPSVNGWEIAAPATVDEWSAAAYFFAKKLRDSLNVAVGIIHASNGGTPVESWMSRESLNAFPEFHSALEDLSESSEKIDRASEKANRKEVESWYDEALAKDMGTAEKWFIPEYDDRGWLEYVVPGYWTEGPCPDLKGIVWYRRSITIPEETALDKAMIRLGQIYEKSTLFINGEFISRHTSNARPAEFIIAPGILQPGTNSLALRIEANRINGGVRGLDEDVFLQIGEKKLDLTGKWKLKKGLDYAELDEAPAKLSLKKRPTVNFNAMIHPLIPYSMRGAIWYQGESNSSNAFSYRFYFKSMIQDWRKRWNEPGMPFYFVQIANYKTKNIKPELNASWPLIRESQSEALELASTAMAVTLDIGETHDVHPKNKEAVGNRLADIAMAASYGDDRPTHGPLFQEFEISDHGLVLQFEALDKLKTRHGKSAAFIIKESSRSEPQRVKAEINDRNVFLRLDNKSFPNYIYYAWEDNPDVYLTDASELPAAPFRFTTRVAAAVNSDLAKDPLLFHNSTALAKLKESTVKDEKLEKIYDKIIKRAEIIYEGPLYSVMDKEKIPPSGDKHDYTSMSPYWWPDPEKPDGLPYIRKDGVVNPERNKFDKVPGSTMAESVRMLTFAWYFSGETRFAEKAVKLIDTWFLNSETKMNPNMNYAQFTPGRADGRSVGIIESRQFVFILDAISLLNEKGLMSPEQFQALEQWYSDFLYWLLTDPLGIEEGLRPNNHGSWYHTQVMAIAVFLGKEYIAEQAYYELCGKASHQIMDDGSQPEELERTRSFSYSNFNLEAHAMGAYISMKLENFPEISRAQHFDDLKLAIGYLAPYLQNHDEWQYTQIKRFEGGEVKLLGALKLLVNIDSNNLYIRILEKLDEAYSGNEVHLLYFGR